MRKTAVFQRFITIHQDKTIHNARYTATSLTQQKNARCPKHAFLLYASFLTAAVIAQKHG